MKYKIKVNQRGNNIVKNILFKKINKIENC